MSYSSVAFLLGAGASVPAGIPDTLGFMEAFRDTLSTHPNRETLCDCLDAIEHAWEGYATQLDVERLYELLIYINQRDGPSPIPLSLPTGFPRRSRATDLLEWELKKCIQEKCLARSTDLAYLAPLADFTQLAPRLNVLTLNYDDCVERVLDDAAIPWTDGFKFDAKQKLWTQITFDTEIPKADHLVRLIKLHGSVTWYATGRDPVQRLHAASQRAVADQLGWASSMTQDAMMVYPTLNKALAHGPFPSLMTAAQSALREASLLLAIGYAFADRHVRRLVIDALATNSALRLVVVDPRPEPILRLLYADADDDSHRRIGIVSTEAGPNGALKYGYVQTSLRDGWLLDRAREWLAGHPVVDPRRRNRGLRGSSETWPRSAPWHLRYALKGGSDGIAVDRSRIFVSQLPSGRVLELDAATGAHDMIAAGFERPEAIAFDSSSNTLYVLDGKYRTERNETVPDHILGKVGIGRLWAVDVLTGGAEALTRWTPGPADTDGSSSETEPANKGIWERERRGAIRWPRDILIEKPGRSLLIAESRRLYRFDIASGTTTAVGEIPDVLNIFGLAREADDTVLLTDAGVAPDGFGRLMRCHLTPYRVEFLREGLARVRGVGVLSRVGIALVCHSGAWPRGHVEAYDLGGRHNPRLAWTGLHHPSHLHVVDDAKTALVATNLGLAELDLSEGDWAP